MATAELEGLVFDMLRYDSDESFLDAVPSALAEEALADAGEPLEPGDRVGAWRIEERLAAGGKGVVYRAPAAPTASSTRPSRSR